MLRRKEKLSIIQQEDIRFTIHQIISTKTINNKILIINLQPRRQVVSIPEEVFLRVQPNPI